LDHELLDSRNALKSTGFLLALMLFVVSLAVILMSIKVEHGAVLSRISGGIRVAVLRAYTSAKG